MKFAFMCRERKNNIGAKVAIIGAGPAGLSAAGYLACEGYEIDVYDKQPLPGGLMTLVIPPWRIPLENVLEGIEELEEKFNVRFTLRTKVFAGGKIHDEGDYLIEETINIEEVLGKYDLVLIATGTWRSKIPKLPGVDARGVMPALEYLYNWRLYEYKYISKRPPMSREVIIIGAGYSAGDAAERAYRAGAEAKIVYRRTRQEAPAGIYEIERLKRMGIDFIELASPVEIIVENGVAKAVKFEKMKLGEPDETGRPRPVSTGEYFTLEANLVLFATGELPTPPFTSEIADKIGVKLNKDGSIQVNDMNYAGSKIFAAGDVVTGPSRIGPAITSGLRVARFMHNLYTTKIGKIEVIK